MNDKMTLPDRVLIVGLGATGIAVARFLSKMGKEITIIDNKGEEELAGALKALEGMKFTPRFGPHREEDFLDHSLIVVSPGVDTALPPLQAARRKGIKVIGEMELAASFIREPIIAITGTNGKTTVTTLLGEIFSRAFGRVFVGGNIGNPLINYVVEGQKAKCLIVEVSSFQLETIESFRPHTAILLNIAEDHLDRYRSYDEYKAAKYRIFENQSPGDFALFNRNSLPGIEVKAKHFLFSTDSEPVQGAWCSGDLMHVQVKDASFSYERGLSPLMGIHNTENLLAVLVASHLYDIDQAIVEEGLRGFRGLAHRVEFVRELEGVRYYNDSKATNVDAAKRALEGIDSNVILIAGGKDKGGSYRVITGLMNRVKALVLIGEAKERILEELGAYTDTYKEKDLRQAVERAHAIARKGDTVLFSPMCSSFDMFRDYKDRGDRFKEMVRSL